MSGSSAVKAHNYIFGEAKGDGRCKQITQVVFLSPDQAARWKARIAPVRDEWLKATPNGGAVLARYTEILAELGAGR